MLKRWFKRKDISNEDPALDLRNQRPGAGEIRSQGSNETLFLAPLPVYTGQVQVSSRNFSQMNDVFLEMGGSNRGLVLQGKIFAAGIWMVLMTAFGLPPLMTLLRVLLISEEPGREFFEMIGPMYDVFSMPAFYAACCIAIYFSGIVSNVRKQAKTYPLRFNRQRREVCFVDSKTHRVLIVPWESVVAWVSNSQAVTSYGATRQYGFGIGLEDEEQDRVHFITIPQFSDAHSLGLWAAIRNYMEEGQLVDAPDPWLTALGLFPSGDRLKNYEGLHSFGLEREDARYMGKMDVVGGEDLSPEDQEKYGFSGRTPWPLRWWYVRRVLTFWKMPFMLAEWGHRKGRPVFPEQVQSWSEPLPPEQWATPSAALLKANQQVRNAMDSQGATFSAACKEAGLH
ncbi:hypothetical protein [Pseudomonas helleri]|uniref:hypothetical protein n=1 Tax=Pseudomonas helleri TaxID=1608996 RepID=UPI0030D8D8BF